MKLIYTGSFTTNGGTSYGVFADSNKSRLASDLSRIAAGNTFPGNTYTCCIYKGGDEIRHWSGKNKR